MEDQEEPKEVAAPCEGCLFIVILILLAIIACLYWGNWGRGEGSGAQASEKGGTPEQPMEIVVNEIPQLAWSKESIERKSFYYVKAKIEQHEYLLIIHHGGWGNFQPIHSESCPCRKSLPQPLIAEGSK